jgi:hypothetical protein
LKAIQDALKLLKGRDYTLFYFNPQTLKAN